MHLASTRSLSDTNNANGGKDMSGVLKLAEAAKQSKLETLKCAAAHACSPRAPTARRRAPRARPSTWLVAVCCRLGYNGLPDKEAEEAVRKAAGPGVEVYL